MAFDELGLSADVLHGIHSMGYMDPTPIQLRAIPPILEGKDVVGLAQTGTGKTAAFALPILTRLATRGGLRALVVEPTRELAAQVETAFRDYARFSPVIPGVVYGGVGYGVQRELLRKGVDVLVATPGRLLDFVEQGDVRLGQVEFLVLDEMDRMLDMGFIPDVRRIVEATPKTRQTMFFSATMPPEVDYVAKQFLREPVVIEVGGRQSPAETVRHALYPVARDQKFDLLLALLEQTNYDSVLIFCRTKDGADRIAHRLKENNHAVAVLHSNRTQNERLEALDGFRKGRYEVMVATDIASRGLDIAGVSHVINFDVPQHPEDYVHRIGRTGRAKSEGDAFTLFCGEDVDQVRSIERFIGRGIQRVRLDNFPYLYTALFEEGKAGAGSAASRRGGRGRRR